jgi:hypothetical protein
VCLLSSEPSNRNKRINDCLATGQLRKIETEFFSGRPEIEDAIFHQRRRQRIGIAMIETKRVAVQCIVNFVTGTLPLVHQK